MLLNRLDSLEGETRRCNSIIFSERIIPITRGPKKLKQLKSIDFKLFNHLRGCFQTIIFSIIRLKKTQLNILTSPPNITETVIYSNGGGNASKVLQLFQVCFGPKILTRVSRGWDFSPLKLATIALDLSFCCYQIFFPWRHPPHIRIVERIKRIEVFGIQSCWDPKIIEQIEAIAISAFNCFKYLGRQKSV